jgi:cytochrome b6-f complex iron-sulfur subunit
MDRKEFLQTCGLCCVGGAAVTTFLSGCSSATYFAKNTVEKNKILIPISEFTTVKNNQPQLRKFVLVTVEKLKYPISVYRISDNEYTALLMECTHKSCELQAQGSYLVCPCHGSEFDNTGKVQNPPAEKNLFSFKTLIENESLVIYL